MRTFEYRLFVNKEQARKLIACLAESRAIYNGMLETVKAQYEQNGTFPSKYELEAAFKGQGEHVPATTEQMLADRLSKSLKHQIVVEDLTICNMVKNHHLAKSIMDASWGAFLAILSEKAERAGHQVIRVKPRFTSQKCHQCGEIVQKSLSVRTHIYPFCGFVADRDVNAAKNILLKGRAFPSGTVSDGSPVELRSPRL